MAWLTWLAYLIERPFEREDITYMLTHLAAHIPQQIQLVFEARGSGGQVNYYLGVERDYARIISDAMKAHGNIRFAEASYRKPVAMAARLDITRSFLALNTEIADVVARSGLMALSQAKDGDEAVVQIVLTKPYSPALKPEVIKDPGASWLKRAFGTVAEASTESQKAIMEKMGAHGFHAVVRLGASGKQAQAHLLSLVSALRTLRSAGVNIQTTPEDPANLNAATVSRSVPLKLSVTEVSAFMLLPAGEDALPGVAGLHPRQIMPPAWYKNPTPEESRVFAMSLDRRTKLSVSPHDAREHVLLFGPSGSGKSTAMLHMIMSDIYRNASLAVVDPKGELIEDILERIPPHRMDDVRLIDPTSPAPLGINPLAYKNHQNPALIADALYNIFYELFKENFGIRTQSVLSAALLTLVRAKGSSLLWLPTLLTDDNFRRKVTAGINDPIGLTPYWAGFEAMNGGERRQEVNPVLSKVNQLLIRENLRNVLGQSQPKFSLDEMFVKPRIVLLNLNKGILGAESSRLLGSIYVGITWMLALGRAAVPERQRKPVFLYIDELQDYISAVGADFDSALAMARSLGLGLVLAHQSRVQLPAETLGGIDANASSKIVFRLKSAADAKAVAAMAPGLEPDDFMALPRYHVYASLNSHGQDTGWLSGVTLPKTKPICDAAALRRSVAEKYGKPGREVEREYLELLARCKAESTPEPGNIQVGKREKP
jgi:energy-coupling factor transporter ATP-binding protein EcfA2